MRLRLLALAALSAAPFVPIQAAQAPAAPALAAATETRWVPFELTPGNQIRFETMLAGETAHAILDTGVSTTVVSRAFSARAGLRLEPGRGERADAIGGAVPIGWTRIDGFALGALRQASRRLAVVDLSAVATGGGQSVDLLMGSDLLACCAIDIDYAARRFRLLPSGRMPFTGARAPLARLPRTGVFSSSASIGGRAVRPLIVDTGDGASLTLSRGAWSAARVRAPAVTTAIGYGLGGAIETELVVLPDVRLGALPPRPVEVRIEPAGGFSDQTGTAGRIGNGWLQRYRVLFDVMAGHLILAPNADAAAAPVKSTSGLLVGYDNGRFSVLHVMRGSPAAAAGWRVRDQICTVDEKPVPPPTGGTVETGWSADTPGRTITFGMCDGSVRRLTLRQFY